MNAENIRTLRHRLRFHRVKVVYYFGYKTATRKCSCGAKWEVPTR